MRLQAWMGLALALWAPGWLLPAGAAASNAELRGMSVFAEAEDFTPPTGWEARPGHGVDMYWPAVSGESTLYCGGPGEASLTVAVPKDGTYAMYLWFTRIIWDPEVTLRVEQDGRTAGASTFIRAQDKIGNWTYRVQKGDIAAALHVGPARLVLSAKAGIAPLDCVLLTCDPAYASPDWKDFSPQCFARFTMLTPEAPAVTAAVTGAWHKSPWYGAAPPIAGSDGRPAPPNTPSAWGEITGALHTGPSPATVRFTFSGDRPLPPRWTVRIEFALQPAANAVVKTVEEEWDGTAAGYVLPGNVAKYLKTNPIRSVIEITNHHFFLLDSLDLPGGKGDFRPTIMQIEGQVYSFSPRLYAKEVQATRLLGFNSFCVNPGQQPDYRAAAKAGAMDPRKFWVMNFVTPQCSYNPATRAAVEQQITALAASLQQTDPALFATLQRIKIGEEPGMPHDLRHMAGCPFCTAAFRSWLQQKGYTPPQLGFADWEAVKPAGVDANFRMAMAEPGASLETRRWCWLSHRFSIESGPLPFKYATEAAHKAFGRRIETRVNLSDMGAVGSAMTLSGNGWDFFTFGKSGATTIPWTEDWQVYNAHIDPFLVDLLRSTAATKRAPLGFYVCWGYGPPGQPHYGDRRTMSAVGRGVKYVDQYWYGPHYSSTECAFSDDDDYLKQIAHVDRLIGLADDVLGRAFPPDRAVAILWSQATEQWQPDAATALERRLLHYALMMQQIPADFLCEADLPTRLKEYRVLYLPATHLDAACVGPLQAWMEAGGTLIVTGGGPDRDELNEPLQGLAALQGLAGIERRKDDPGYSHEGLVRPEPTARVTMTGRAAPLGVAGYRAALQPAPGTAITGTYADGSAAAVEHRAGKGRVLTYGFYPGITLLMRIRSDASAQGRFWSTFYTPELQFIAAPVIAAGALPPVSTTLGVDAARLDAANGSAITLTNYHEKPLGIISLLVRGLPSVKRAVSCARGPLPFKKTAAGIVLDVPLDYVDIIKLYK